MPFKSLKNRFLVLERSLMFRLLPVQILLAAVGTVNGIVSSIFAANGVGVEAMSAVGLYGPLSSLLGAFNAILIVGSSTLCSKYIGQHRHEELQNVFTLDLLISLLLGLLCTAAFVLLSVFDLTGFLVSDETARSIFNTYLLGQAVGIVPFILGNQLPVFLSLENKGGRALTASLVYIAANILFNFLFVNVLHMEALGLALASSMGLWVLLAVETEFYLSGKSRFRLQLNNPQWQESGNILKIGIPGALGQGYQTVRGVLVNHIIQFAVGSIGISAFAAANNLLGIFWAIPAGMLSVSRMLIGISVGEEDRDTLKDVMRVVFRYFVPGMLVISGLLIVFAEALTNIFYQDPSELVYSLTLWCLRILPLCMPTAVICMHFTCYAQTADNRLLVHLLSFLDGIGFVVTFSALLIRPFGLNGVCIANVLNGIGCVLVILGYSCVKNRCFPRTLDQLMVIPEDFGVGEDARLDLTVEGVEDVVTVSKNVMAFCKERGMEERLAYLSGLFLEEMAGNVVLHGFHKDRRPHIIEIRLVNRDDDIILRIRDNCIPFDPWERRSLSEIGTQEDPYKNIGINLVLKEAKKVDYQNMLGLNVLMIWV